MRISVAGNVVELHVVKDGICEVGRVRRRSKGSDLTLNREVDCCVGYISTVCGGVGDFDDIQAAADVVFGWDYGEGGCGCGGDLYSNWGEINPT